MERSGYVSIDEYGAAAIKEKTSAILAEQEKLQKVSEKPAS